mmetsp:Transcript_23388/g.27630  ORF Transcript_23388/g.27630 Transcript_23388/m.27630 type:complete len:316 (-) Transcript_23388:38-985(-)
MRAQSHRSCNGMTINTLVLCSLLIYSTALTVPVKIPHGLSKSSSNASPRCMVTTNNDNDIDIENLGLTPQLATMTKAFSSIPDEKMRYKQLLYMANQLKPMDPRLMVPENKVPGCLSTVFVDCVATEKKGEDGAADEIVLDYIGESDGLLTKGLVALLVRGLSGCTPEQIEKVNPEFINAAKISQSLTPGRNNGFLNMLKVMKQKAAAVNSVGVDEAIVDEEQEVEIITSFEQIEDKPMYNEIMNRLINVLKPNKIELVDISQKSYESHFNLIIVVAAFENLPIEKRKQIIFLVLGDIMEKIQDLEIKAMSPDEV